MDRQGESHTLFYGQLQVKELGLGQTTDWLWVTGALRFAAPCQSVLGAGLPRVGAALHVLRGTGDGAAHQGQAHGLWVTLQSNIWASLFEGTFFVVLKETKRNTTICGGFPYKKTQPHQLYSNYSSWWFLSNPNGRHHQINYAFVVWICGLEDWGGFPLRGSIPKTPLKNRQVRVA